jgi:hypothetical protein
VNGGAASGVATQSAVALNPFVGTGTAALSATGFIYEFLNFNRSLSVPERQQIEGYLAWKWGTQANLPVSHPYYSGPVSTNGVALWSTVVNLIGPTGVTGPTGASAAYTPATPANWTGTAPTTVAGALDRIATALVSLSRYP